MDIQDFRVAQEIVADIDHLDNAIRQVRKALSSDVGRVALHISDEHIPIPRIGSRGMDGKVPGPPKLSALERNVLQATLAELLGCDTLLQLNLSDI
jgi:hypothetical protein